MIQTKFLKLATGAAVILGFVLGIAGSSAHAQFGGISESRIYLWKDAKGKCPTICDNNEYACPCYLSGT